VEFRFDLGAGPALLRSSQAITLGNWHKVTAKRYHADGILKLDNLSPVVGRAVGALGSLDVLQSAYVGAAPPAEDVDGGVAAARIILRDQLGLEDWASGMRGCIRRLLVGRREVKLQAPSEPLASRRVGLRECGRSPCEGAPCAGGDGRGTCQASADGSYFTCRCSSAYAGVRCETPAGEEALASGVCDSSPCMGGAECISSPNGDFQCRCPPGLSGQRCERHGNSLILLIYADIFKFLNVILFSR